MASSESNDSSRLKMGQLASTYRRVFESYIVRLEIKVRQLELLVDDSRSLDIYSAEKIMEMNRVRREIPLLISRLQEYRDRASIQNPDFLLGGDAKKGVTEIEIIFQKIFDLAINRTTEIPNLEVSSWALYWILHPVVNIRSWWYILKTKVLVKFIEMRTKKMK